MEYKFKKTSYSADNIKPIYHYGVVYDPYGKKRGDFPLFRSANGFTFSSLINEDIRRVKLGLPD